MQTIRPVRSEDIPALLEIQKRQADGLGYTPWFPPFDDPKIEAFMVIEEDGEVLGAVYFRQITEMGLLAATPRALRVARKMEGEIRSRARSCGIDELICFTLARLKSMGRVFSRTGFRELTDRYKVFEGRI